MAIFLCLGQYCNGTAATGPRGDCAPGWYCTGGAKEEKPTDASTGGMCVPGQYCPSPASVPIACDPGMYCELPELSSPSGNCSAGFYCANGSASKEPDGSDLTKGELVFLVIFPVRRLP